ncbi:MAG: hypothetical protein IPL32_20495 [Chloracidobacterium sp.]|nr:hypothetical protein [Chloracidobacterium sp.]
MRSFGSSAGGEERNDVTRRNWLGELEVIGKTEGGGRCDEPIARVEPQCDDSAVWVQPSGTVGERDGADGERANQNVPTPRRDAAGRIVGTRYRTGGWTMRQRLQE